MSTARTGGKVILLGEHAVVYGVPALAVGIERAAAPRSGAVELNERPGIDHGEPPEQHLVEQREDGRVGADAEAERQDDDDGEAAGPREGPDRVAEILKQRAHGRAAGEDRASRIRWTATDRRGFSPAVLLSCAA